MQNGAGEFLIVDAETRELRLTFARALAARWAVQFELPYRETNGGSLDSFIDDWHGIFGLPEGARPIQPEDRLRLHYWRDGETLIELGTPIEGFADASASLVYSVHHSDQSAVSAALSVKVPTGKNHWLNSSGAVDVSAIIAAEHRLNDCWSIAGQAAASVLGNGDLLPHLQRELVWSGRAGVSFQLTPALDVILQMDAHSSAFDSELDFFSESVVATLGANVEFGPSWTLSFGLSEDITVEHSPDVVFVIGLKKSAAE